MSTTSGTISKIASIHFVVVVRVFKNNILQFIRSKPDSFFKCCNLKAIRLITWLRLELSHLREHNFRYNFQNCFNPLCSCGSSIESTSHFLLHCPVFHDKRHFLLSTLNNIDSKILESPYFYLTRTLLFGFISFHSETNTLVLNATIYYILSTEISQGPLWYKKNVFHMQLFNFFRACCGLFHLSVFYCNYYFDLLCTSFFWRAGGGWGWGGEYSQEP